MNEANKPKCTKFEGKEWSTLVVTNAFELKEQLRRLGYRYSPTTLLGPGWMKDMIPSTCQAEEKKLEGIGVHTEIYVGT